MMNDVIRKCMRAGATSTHNGAVISPVFSVILNIDAFKVAGAPKTGY